jgi:hypothetical protein
VSFSGLEENLDKENFTKNRKEQKNVIKIECKKRPKGFYAD